MSVAANLACFTCALGSVVFGAAIAETRARLVAAGLAFLAVLALPVATSALSATGGTSFVTALLALGHLGGWKHINLLAVAAGWLAGTWMTVLHEQGAPLVAAGAIAVTLPWLGGWLARRSPAFAPPRLMQEALIIVAVVAICAAAAPGLVEGWQVATQLKASAGPPPEEIVAVPTWALTASVLATLTGVGFGARSRR